MSDQDVRFCTGLSVWSHTVYLDLVLIRVAVHLAHSVPDGATSTLDTCLKCLESSPNVCMLISLCKENLYLRFLLRPNGFLNFGHDSRALLLEQIIKGREGHFQSGNVLVWLYGWYDPQDLLYRSTAKIVL